MPNNFSTLSSAVDSMAIAGNESVMVHVSVGFSFLYGSWFNTNLLATNIWLKSKAVGKTISDFIF